MFIASPVKSWSVGGNGTFPAGEMEQSVGNWNHTKLRALCTQETSQRKWGKQRGRGRGKGRRDREGKTKSGGVPFFEITR